MTGNTIEYKRTTIEEHYVNGQLYYYVEGEAFDTFEAAKDFVDAADDVTQEVELGAE